MIARAKTETARYFGTDESVPPALSVIVPALDEENTAGEMVTGIRKALDEAGVTAEILLIDDGSTDGTAGRAEAAGARVIRHPYPMGNGAAVKTGIRHARGTWLLMMDADGQHDPAEIKDLMNQLGCFDMVVGARARNSDWEWRRYWANKAFNALASYVCGRRIEDLTSGFRLVRADAAREFLHLLPNGFSYPTTLTLAAAHAGYSLRYVPVRARKRSGRSKIKPLRDGFRFIHIIARIAVLYSPMKIFLPLSVFLTGSGLVSGLLGPWRRPPAADVPLLLAVGGILVFCIGLLAEQNCLRQYGGDPRPARNQD